MQTDETRSTVAEARLLFWPHGFELAADFTCEADHRRADITIVNTVEKLTDAAIKAAKIRSIMRSDEAT